jgi:hypothetical protein
MKKGGISLKAKLVFHLVKDGMLGHLYVNAEVTFVLSNLAET